MKKVFTIFIFAVMMVIGTMSLCEKAYAFHARYGTVITMAVETGGSIITRIVNSVTD